MRLSMALRTLGEDNETGGEGDNEPQLTHRFC